MTVPVVSIVIPAHNCARTIVDQLDAIGRAMDGVPSTEIIVVDNRSTDGTADVVERWSNESLVPVAIVRADEKPSEPYARNIGLDVARGELILYCDGDDEVDGTWIRAMVEALDDADFATGPVRTDRLNEPWIADVRGQSVFDGTQRLHDTIPFAHGCNMGFRRSTLRDLGGFDEEFPIGCDQVVAVRAWKAGVTLVVADDAVVHYRLRPDLRATFRQGYAYARARRSIQRLTPDLIDTNALRGAWLRRVGWLGRHSVRAIRNRPTRARWVWVASLVVGEAPGLLRPHG